MGWKWNISAAAAAADECLIINRIEKNLSNYTTRNNSIIESSSKAIIS